MRLLSTTSLLLALLLSACASEPKKERALDYSRAFNASYEVVWRATQQAMLNYPMNINNMDTGQLQTLFITGKHRFKPPHRREEVLPSGYQYRLNINIIRNEDNKRAKVIISKEARLQKDFFSNPEDLGSDGFEEKSILYRIKREVIIELLLKRAMESKSGNQNS